MLPYPIIGSVHSKQPIGLQLSLWVSLVQEAVCRFAQVGLT